MDSHVRPEWRAEQSMSENGSHEVQGDGCLQGGLEEVYVEDVNYSCNVYFKNLKQIDWSVQIW